jgi:hypothetical protein
MTSRLFALLIGALLMAPHAQAGQATTNPKQQPTNPKQQPRTPWGDPDLQGNWDGGTLTPMQRPARFANKPVLTPEEAKAVVAEVLGRPGQERRSSNPEKDVQGAYNSVFNIIAGDLSDGRTSLIIDPPDGKIPPLTPEARKRADAQREFLQALLQGTVGGRPGPISPRHEEPPPYYNIARMNRADGPEDRALGERCINFLPNLGAVYQIVQSPGQVGIYHDSGQGSGFVRVIPVNGSPHVPSRIRFWNGDARGRWEGDTLVVDITNFNRRREFQGSRDNLHLIERFRRVNANRLEYTLTVDDPTTFTRSWTLMVPWTKQSDKANQVYESNCHEGNYGLMGILANMRASDKRFKEGKGRDPRTMDNATGADTGGGIEIDRTAQEKEAQEKSNNPK